MFDLISQTRVIKYDLSLFILFNLQVSNQQTLFVFSYTLLPINPPTQSERLWLIINIRHYKWLTGILLEAAELSVFSGVSTETGTSRLFVIFPLLSLVVSVCVIFLQFSSRIWKRMLPENRTCREIKYSTVPCDTEVSWKLENMCTMFDRQWQCKSRLGRNRFVSSIPGSVGYISHVHWAYDYLGPFGVLWVHMAWHKNCVKKV